MDPTTAFLSGPHGNVHTPSTPSANNTCTGELVDDQWNFQVAGDVRDCNTAIDLNETTIMFSNSVSGDQIYNFLKNKREFQELQE